MKDAHNKTHCRGVAQLKKNKFYKEGSYFIKKRTE